MPDAKIETFPCQNCGGDLEFKPGIGKLKCLYCGSDNEVPESTAVIKENSYLATLKHTANAAECIERIAVTCDSCGAELTFDPNITADECSYCGSNIVAQSHSTKLIKPAALLPFKITKNEASTNFSRWLRGRWFLPNKVKKFARMQPLSGIYAPYWTYDCTTVSKYTGQRGEYYYTTETYTTTVNGKSVTRTRQVRRIRWYPCRGVVTNNFDDILVLGSKTLPKKYADELEPWDLDELKPYTEGYLSGFRVESYSVNLETGFIEAQDRTEPQIRYSVEEDIGGDCQRISSLDISFQDVSFKHILLPIWISSFKFKEKVFRFLVNARTGEVQGERPWSWIKITLFILAIIAVGIGLIILAQN